MASEDAAGVAATEDVAELQRLLAAARRSAETSRRRASDASTQASRWRNHRDEFAAAARAALGMGPGGPVNIHTGPILERLGEVLAERDMAVARLAAAGKALDDERGEHAQTIKALEGQRALQRTERKAIAAREGAVERRMEAARAEAERAAERAAKALAAVTERAEKAKRRVSQVELELSVLRSDRAAREEERRERVALTKASARIEALEAEVAREREAARAAELRAQAAELRARDAEMEREARARPEPSPVRPAPIGVLSEVEQITAADRIARSPRVVAALRGKAPETSPVDVAALLRSGSPVAVALGRVALGGAGEVMDRAALVLALAQAWAKGVR